MRPSHLFAPLVFVALLCGCGSRANSSASSSSSSSQPSGGCPFHDTVKRLSSTSTIFIYPPNNPASHITATVALPCSTTVRAFSGSAKLRYANGTGATCQFEQDEASKTARLISRDQAGDLLALQEGKVDCSWPPTSLNQAVNLCDVGTVFATGGYQGEHVCQPEPFFLVAVLAREVRVTAPGLDRTVPAGYQITYDLTTRKYQVTVAQFMASDVIVLQEQAQEMGLRVARAPQAITFTSVKPAKPAIGETYVVTATGGGSGHPVIFKVDPASGKACVPVSSQTVKFTAAGICIIDANQAGTAQFQAAPQAQLSITIS